jgi:hypothetical protein
LWEFIKPELIKWNQETKEQGTVGMTDKCKGYWVAERSSGFDGCRCKYCATWIYLGQPFVCDCDKKTVDKPKESRKVTTMKYTSNVRKLKPNDQVHLVLGFDRHIANGNIYFDWFRKGGTFERDRSRYGITDEVLELLQSIEDTPGVIKGKDSGHIHVEGNRLTVRVIGIHANPISEIANQIVKKVNRRLAKGENRQLVKTQ